MQTLKGMGTEITSDIPNFKDVMEGFQTLHTLLLPVTIQPILQQHRDQISRDIINCIERCLMLMYRQSSKLNKSEQASAVQ